MADFCRACMGRGYVTREPIADYSPCALPVWQMCACQLPPPAPEAPRVHPDDLLAAHIAASGIEYLPEAYDDV